MTKTKENKDKKKDPLKELYEILEDYEEGYKERDLLDYDM